MLRFLNCFTFYFLILDQNKFSRYFLFGRQPELAENCLASLIKSQLLTWRLKCCPVWSVQIEGQYGHYSGVDSNDNDDDGTY